MSTTVKERSRALPATPCGLLPPRMRVLFITTARRTGAWLAEALASDSACQVILEDAYGAQAGLARLRDQVFDAVLVSHDAAELDALELVDGLRAGGAEEPLVVLGQQSEPEMAALCFEVGADAYICVHTATIRTLLWIVSRATERHHLLRENRRLAQAERHRSEQEHGEAHRLLSQQRDFLRELDPAAEEEAEDEEADPAFSGQRFAAIGQRAAADGQTAPLGAALVSHYRELLRAHVIMGSGNLASEMAALAESLAAEGIAAPQVMQMHVQVLEELVRGLGNRSARHVMSRADLLVLEILVHLAERYRLRCAGEA